MKNALKSAPKPKNECILRENASKRTQKSTNCRVSGRNTLKQMTKASNGHIFSKKVTKSDEVIRVRERVVQTWRYKGMRKEQMRSVY